MIEDEYERECMKKRHHNGRGRGQKKGKVEKFSYHKIYNEVEDEIYEKKGLEKWTNFRITKYTVG